MDSEISPKTVSSGKAKSRLISKMRGWLPYVVIIAVFYFGNIEVQSYLGRKAMAETGLTMLSLDEALTKARAENKLVLADLSAVWCSSCRKLDKSVLSNQQVKAAIEKKYIFSRIEYESPEGKAFMAQYQVRGFPTLVVIDAEGSKVSVLPLTFDPGQFMTFL